MTQQPDSTEHMNTSALLANARSFLFVPGNRPERFGKALQSGADAVVLDVEDSVPPGDKAAARTAIGQAWAGLQAAGVALVVRINPAGQSAGVLDLQWLATLTPAAAIMLPKAESAAALKTVNQAFAGSPVLPIIESAAGYLAVQEIAAAPGVLRLVVGHIDFMADTGLQCSADEPELAPLRFAVTMASRAHGLAAPVDGVTVSLNDETLLRQDTGRAQRFGFGAKLCIHPRQVATVHEVLAPSAQEQDWARRVLAADAAAGGAAVQLDGRMVDAPVVLQAQRLLARIRPQRQS